MIELEMEVLADGFAFPEGPRWHDDRFWFSDQHAKFVYAMDGDGKAEKIVAVPNQPSGLGWLPDGRMLVVSMVDKRVLRREPDGELAEHADLGALAPGQCNDMVVGPTGRAYVGNFGFDMYGGASPVDTHIMAVEVDGTAHIAADGIAFPNGTVITPDGNTLMVGESWGRRITVYDIHDDGTLANARVWAQLAHCTVDGMCLDAEGAIWVACPFTGTVRRILEGGEETHIVRGTHPGAFACMLGGPERRTLFMCTASTHVPAETLDAMGGRIETVTVDVPGAGWP